MTRSTATTAAVAVVVGTGTATLALAATQGWASGGAVDALLAVGFVVTLSAVCWLLIAAVATMLLRAAAWLLAPEQPPALTRIARLMEEQAAVTARRHRRFVSGDPEPTGTSSHPSATASDDEALSPIQSRSELVVPDAAIRREESPS